MSPRDALRLVVAVLLAYALAPQEVLAQRRNPAGGEPAEDPVDAVFERYDENRDGRLDPAEFRRFRGNPYAFEAVDRNGDGEISRRELRQKVRGGRIDLGDLPVLRPMAVRVETVDPAEFDTDGDGRISRREFRDWMFALADQTGDGAIDRAEARLLAQAEGFQQKFAGRVEELLDEWDRNGDGRIKPSEFRPDRTLFDLFDADGNGRLDATEIVPRRDDPLLALAHRDVDALLEEYDRNGDGALSRGEFPGGAGRGAFGRVDRDSDGRVTRDELGRALDLLGRYQFLQLDPSFLARYDANGDGRVSRREFPAAEPAFRRLDRNGDGFISPKDARIAERP